MGGINISRICWKKKEERIRLQVFWGMSLEWRVEWGFGLWFFHLLLYPTINSCNPFNFGLSIYARNKDNYPIQLSYFVAWILENNIKYMGVLRPSKWRKKKRQARPDCVRLSRAPTSK
jgi:hypothetical protein